MRICASFSASVARKRLCWRSMKSSNSPSLSGCRLVRFQNFSQPMLPYLLSGDGDAVLRERVRGLGMRREAVLLERRFGLGQFGEPFLLASRRTVQACAGAVRKFPPAAVAAKEVLRQASVPLVAVVVGFAHLVHEFSDVCFGFLG